MLFMQGQYFGDHSCPNQLHLVPLMVGTLQSSYDYLVFLMP